MRETRLVYECIEKFGLDLSGFQVFTEAATGQFSWTPIIALLAKAQRVYAIAKDSRFGKKTEAAIAVQKLADLHHCVNRLQVVYDYNLIGQADIITNLGFVRPITKNIITNLKPTAVISLMWETWEFRVQDLDLSTCIENEILVLGTNEHHPSLQTFKYIGLLATKLLYESGLEILRSRILTVGGGEFGESVAHVLKKNEAAVKIVCQREHLSNGLQDLWISESIGSENVIEFIRNADAIVFAEHQSEVLILGKQADLRVEDLLKLNRDIKIIHISGLIDSEEIINNGIQIVPQPNARTPRTMSLTTAYLGPRPLIELHVAGLKVGEVMAKARILESTIHKAKKEALNNHLCQDFPPRKLKISIE